MATYNHIRYSYITLFLASLKLGKFFSLITFGFQKYLYLLLIKVHTTSLITHVLISTENNIITFIHEKFQINYKFFDKK